MNGYAKICAVAYWLALVAWFAVLTATAVAAISAFGALSETELTLHAYPKPEFADHGTLAAGMVTQPIFVFADIVQVACIVVTLITLALQVVVFKMPIGRPANWIRAVALIGATLFVGYRAVLIQPNMNDDLQAYQSTLQDNRIEMARQHKRAFDAAHGAARRLHDGTFACVLVAVMASAAAYVPNRREMNESPAPGTLEEPVLNRRSSS